jgi:hypothetical protein
VLASTRRSQPVLADPKVLELLSMVWVKPSRKGEDGVLVGRQGVTFKGLHYGQGDPDLLLLQGQQVRVSYDPNDVSIVGVWDMSYRFICRAPCNMLSNRNDPASDEHVLEVVRKDGDLAYRSNAEIVLAAQAAEHARSADPGPRTPEPERKAVGAESAVEPTDPRVLRLIQTPLDGASKAIRSGPVCGLAPEIELTADDYDMDIPSAPADDPTTEDLDYDD